MKKDWMLLLAISVFVLLVAINFIDYPAEKKALVVLKGSTFNVELVSSPNDMAQGLSGREGLIRNTGMLFDFGSEQNPTMWMKDMKFSIDIIWMDGRGVVTHFVERLQPCKDLRACTTFSPGAPSRYVLEVPAGTVSELGLGRGDKAKIDL